MNRASCERRLSLPDQLAADEEAADLVGAGADVVELGVAQVALHRIVAQVAGPAQRLDGLERRPDAVLGRQQDRAGGVETGGAARIAGLGDGRSEERRV